MSISRPSYLNISHLWLATLALSLFTLPAFGQVKNTKKLSRIPPPSSESLIRRLELFVQYDRAREYEKQFDLLSRSYLGSNKFDREAYVEFRRKEVRGTLLEIKIHKARLHPKENYVEMATSTKRTYKGRVVDDIWNFTAYLQDGEWYFDYAWIDI